MNQYQHVFERLSARAPEIAGTNAAERIDKIRRLYQAVYDLRAEVGEAGFREIGTDGRAQLVPLKDMVADAARNLTGWMEVQDVPPSQALMGRRGYAHHEPKGVVLHLATWNAPVLISIAPLMSMIAAGNAVVLKPSEIAPHSAEVVRRIVAQAGLEDDIAVITGGPETAQALLKLPFNHVCYVGSNRIGRLVMQAAAEHFAGVTLEMGGKNPVVVMADADLDEAAARIVFGRMILAGQACLGPDYILVEEGVRADFSKLLVEKVNAFYDPEGKGFAASPDLPRIISEAHALRIGGLIEDAVAKGSRLLLGGEIVGKDRFVSPTILDGIDETMDIFQEEVFGPVLTIQGFSSRGEVLAEIAKRPKPLGFYIFTGSREAADWFIGRTRAGSSAVNNVATQALVPDIPFGGVNHSGIGSLNGLAGFREFSNVRGVVEDSLDPAAGTPMFYPPFPAEAGLMIDQMLMPDPLPAEDAQVHPEATDGGNHKAGSIAMTKVEGVWDCVTKSPIGDQQSVLTIESDGQSLTGTNAGPMGTFELLEGRVDGDKLKWKMKVTQPIAMELDANATVDGDRLTGSLKMGMFGTSAMTGTRRS